MNSQKNGLGCSTPLSAFQGDAYKTANTFEKKKLKNKNPTGCYVLGIS